MRTFVRHFFDHAFSLEGDALLQELRMTEPMVGPPCPACSERVRRSPDPSRSFPASPSGAGAVSKAVSSAGMPTSSSRLANTVWWPASACQAKPPLLRPLTRPDSNKARDSFKTFIPISVENGAKQRIIFDFFDLIAAVAAHGKSNGFGGRQLSRMAAWWAFEQKDTGTGFDGGYKAWLRLELHAPPPRALCLC